MNKAMNLGYYAMIGDISLLNGEAAIFRSLTRDDVSDFACRCSTMNNSSTLIYRAK